MAIKKMILGDTTVWVEVDDELAIQGDQSTPPGVGANIEQVSNPLQEGFDSVKANIKAISEQVHEAFKNNAPDQYEVEFSFAFGFDTKIIPILVTNKTNATLKVKAQWKKSD